jgi:large subunit ribosomal protein L13
MADTEKAAPPPAPARAARNVQKSFVMTKQQAQRARAWWVIDASGKRLGRLASQVAHVLRGKHKPQYTPHEDTGDFVIVVNAHKVTLTGAKLDKKFAYRHSGIPGGFRSESYRSLLVRNPVFPVEKAVRGMLPKGVLGREMFTKLKVYATPDHPHAAQQPKPL